MNFKDVIHLFMYNTFKVFLICEYSINLPLIFTKRLSWPLNGLGHRKMEKWRDRYRRGGPELGSGAIASLLNLVTCGCGVIGSRARLRIWCRKAWGFESLHPHQNPR